MTLDPAAIGEVVRGKTIVLAVSGSISAYKVVELARRLTQAGAAVQVVMTRAAAAFVTPLTFQALTYRPVEVEVFGAQDDRAAGHVAMGRAADVIVVAPASAHTIARLALGMADDLVATTVLATSAPVVIAPAMETHMWTNAATRENVARLVARGARVVEPEAGELASGMSGPGRLASLERIVAVIEDALATRSLLAGKHVIVTAGPTLEPIDPVRVVTNRSSGKMGYAIADAALRAGADVTLVSGPTALHAPSGARVVTVETGVQMRDAVLSALPTADAVVMAAAVADYRPAHPAPSKLKKRDAGAELRVDMVENPDVLKAIVGARRPGTIVVGFKAETGSPDAEAATMLREKHLDMVVANDVSDPVSAFGGDTSRVTFVSADGAEELPVLAKAEVARRLIAKLAERLA